MTTKQPEKRAGVGGKCSPYRLIYCGLALPSSVSEEKTGKEQ